MSITSSSFELYKRNLNIITPILIGTLISTFLLLTWNSTFVPYALRLIGRPRIMTSPLIFLMVRLIVLLFSPMLIVTNVILTIMEGVTALVSKDIIERREADISKAFRDIKSSIVSLIIVAIIVEIIEIILTLIPFIGGPLSSLIRTLFSAAPVLIVINDLKPLDSLIKSYEKITKLWEEEGIAVVIIFVIFLLATIFKGYIGFILLTLGLPYIILMLTCYIKTKVV